MSIKRLPVLSPERLKLMIQAVQKSHMSEAGKRAVILSLKAGANPDAESPEVIIRSLPVKRRELVEGVLQQLFQFSNTLKSRGVAKLEQISDIEWNKLVQSAAEESDDITV